jgi:hypothetical protein
MGPVCRINTIPRSPDPGSDSVIDVPLARFMEDFQCQRSGRRREPAAGSGPFVRISRSDQRDHPLKEISPQEAGRLFSRLDQLTDDEVETLLTKSQQSYLGAADIVDSGPR